MKPLILLLGLLVTSTCKTVEEPVKFRTISEGSYSAATPARAEAHIVMEAAAYEQMWNQLIGRGERPAVDFTSEVAVLLMAGQKRSGGYAVAAKGATVDGETLVIDADVTAPEPGMMVTQALTSPWKVLAVSRRDVKNVRWDE